MASPSNRPDEPDLVMLQDVQLLPAFLTTDEVAELLRVNPSTVCRWRLSGRGPRVTWLSAKIPRYRKADVLDWVVRLAS